MVDRPSRHDTDLRADTTQRTGGDMALHCISAASHPPRNLTSCASPYHPPLPTTPLGLGNSSRAINYDRPSHQGLSERQISKNHDATMTPRKDQMILAIAHERYPQRHLPHRHCVNLDRLSRPRVRLSHSLSRPLIRPKSKRRRPASAGSKRRREDPSNSALREPGTWRRGK
jgi:hypothetical protein